MAVVPYPDLSGAIRAFIRSLPGVTTLVAERVWIGWPRDPHGDLRVKVPPYLYAVLIESGRGGPPPDPEAPFLIERVDLSCLGPDEAGASALWRQLGPALYDPHRTRPQGFRAANTLVDAVVPEGGPVRLLDPPTGWPRVVATYQFRYCAIPLSELSA
jgi:hypothetical protein